MNDIDRKEKLQRKIGRATVVCAMCGARVDSKDARFFYNVGHICKDCLNPPDMYVARGEKYD
jgi:hypothetical protein